MKHLLLLLTLLTISCSQNAKLSGEVYTTNLTGETVMQTATKVHIFKKEKADGSRNIFKDYDKADFTATTDSAGKFSVTVPRGWYTVVAESKGGLVRSCWAWPVNVDDSEETISLSGSNTHHGTQAESCGEDVRLR